MLIPMNAVGMAAFEFIGTSHNDRADPKIISATISQTEFHH